MIEWNTSAGGMVPFAIFRDQGMSVHFEKLGVTNIIMRGLHQVVK